MPTPVVEPSPFFPPSLPFDPLDAQEASYFAASARIESFRDSSIVSEDKPKIVPLTIRVITPILPQVFSGATTMAGQTSTRTAVALTILRIVIGAVFMMHGYQKWFVMGIPGVTGFFTSVG